MHGILEKYFNGLITIPEMRELYVADYDTNVTCKFPYNRFVDMAESYYQDGLEFLEKFRGLSENYVPIGVEMEARLPIGGYDTVGYIDLLLEDRNGGLIIVDHKSKKKFHSKAEEESYRRQLLFYGIYVKELFGKYPKYVDFDMFRSRKHVIAKFDEAECDAVKEWFLGTIERAIEDEEFKDKIEINCYDQFKSLDSFKKDDFFCNEICGVREHCPRSKAYKKKRKKKTEKGSES